MFLRIVLPTSFTLKMRQYILLTYRDAGKSAWPGRKQAQKPVKDTRDFNIKMQAVIKFFSCKARRRRKFMPFWQKHQLVSFLVGLRTYQHPCTFPVHQTCHLWLPSASSHVWIWLATFLATWVHPSLAHSDPEDGGIFLWNTYLPTGLYGIEHQNSTNWKYVSVV